MIAEWSIEVFKIVLRRLTIAESVNLENAHDDLSVYATGLFIDWSGYLALTEYEISGSQGVSFQNESGNRNIF